MSLVERDYILRMIQQIGEGLARIASARSAGQHQKALRLVRETTDGILGPLGGMVERLDSASAAALIGGADRVGAYATLLVERAKTHEEIGDQVRSHADNRRALELFLEQLAVTSEPDPALIETIRSIRAHVKESRLAERYQHLLASRVR